MRERGTDGSSYCRASTWTSPATPEPRPAARRNLPQPALPSAGVLRRRARRATAGRGRVVDPRPDSPDGGGGPSGRAGPAVSSSAHGARCGQEMSPLTCSRWPKARPRFMRRRCSTRPGPPGSHAPTSGQAPPSAESHQARGAVSAGQLRRWSPTRPPRCRRRPRRPGRARCRTPGRAARPRRRRRSTVTTARCSSPWARS